MLIFQSMGFGFFCFFFCADKLACVLMFTETNQLSRLTELIPRYADPMTTQVLLCAYKKQMCLTKATEQVQGAF